MIRIYRVPDVTYCSISTYPYHLDLQTTRRTVVENNTSTRHLLNIVAKNAVITKEDNSYIHKRSAAYDYSPFDEYSKTNHG